MSLIGAFMATLGGPTVQLANVTTTNTAVDPADATASYSLESDGDVVRSNATGAGTTDIGDWVTPTSAAGAAYECRATVNSGSVSTGTTGSWLALSSTRTWTRAQTSIGSANVNLTIEIRRASDGTVLASATVDLTATVTA